MAKTGLHWAAINNDLVKGLHLISQGYNVNARDRLARTPLHCVAIKNYNNDYYRIAEALLENGADPTFRDSWGFAPIEYLVKNGGAQIVQLFLNFCDLSVWNDNGCSLLFEAVYHNNPTFLKTLLEEFPKMDVNCRKEHGHNPNVLKILLDEFPEEDDANYRKEPCQTPLHFAMEKHKDGSHSKVIKVLLDKGARIDLKDSKDFTPIWYLFKYDEFKILDIFFNFTEGAAKVVPKFTGGIIRKKDFELLLAHTDFDRIGDYEESLGEMQYLPMFFGGWILEHIAKFETLDEITEVILENVIRNRQEYTDFYDDCLNEVQRAKDSTIEDTGISFYSLLVGNAIQMKNYARNDALIAAFFRSDCRWRFPIYGTMITENVVKGMDMKVLFDRSVRVLSDCLPLSQPNLQIVTDLLKCIESESDLMKLCDLN